MNIQPKIRNAVLVGALAAVAATAWATNENLTTSPYVAPMALERPIFVSPTAVAVEQSLAPNETLVASERVAAPVEDRIVAQTGIIVQERKPSEDERIQMAVMDRLASSPRISGKIGVESHGSVVTLSGYTITAGQVYRAGREAGSITGVKYVQNEIRPRIGGSV